MNRDIALETGLPANLDAERAVLGSLMLGYLDMGIARGLLEG
jgi:hypothetical protein